MKGNYHEIIKTVANVISGHLSETETLDLSGLSRACRLQYGVGRTTIVRIIREDYPDYIIDGDIVRRRT